MLTNDLASAEEAGHALRSLSQADMARLRQIAKIRTSGMAWLDWQDLLHDSIDRVLDGSRRWPRSVPFVPFMREVMRSIASENWRRHVHGLVRSESEFAVAEDAGIAAYPSEAPDPEREAAAKQCLDLIFALFEQDGEARAILLGMSQGASPEEIQRAAGITEKSYATAQRRVRRTLNRAFPTKETWS